MRHMMLAATLITAGGCSVSDDVAIQSLQQRVASLDSQIVALEGKVALLRSPADFVPDDASIVYPAEGNYGINLLDTSVTSASSGVAHTYSLRAEASAPTHLEVTMTLAPFIPDETRSGENLWYFFDPVNHTWAISEYDWDTGHQRFVATPIDEFEPGISDLTMYFEGTGTVEFNYFEHGASEPTFTKTLTWR